MCVGWKFLGGMFGSVWQFQLAVNLMFEMCVGSDCVVWVFGTDCV